MFNNCLGTLLGGPLSGRGKISFLEFPEMICCPIDENNSATGHPVIFPRKYFNSLTEITGDIGAREVLKKDKHSINYFSTNRRSYFLDLDTPEEWSSWINFIKN